MTSASPDEDGGAGTRISHSGERESLLAATMAHAKARDAEYRDVPAGPRRAEWWAWATSGTLLLATVFLLAAPPGWVTGPPLPTLSAEDVTAGIHATLFLQATAVEAFRDRAGRLPTTLDETGVVLPGLRYIRSNSRVFQLVAEGPDGTARVWDSADPPAESRALAERWLRRAPEP